MNKNISVWNCLLILGGNMKRVWNVITKKAFVATILLIVEIVLLIFMMVILGRLFIFFGIGLYIVSLITILFVVNDMGNPAYKISWITSIILIPFAGSVLYIIFGKKHTTKNMKKKFNYIDAHGRECMSNMENNVKNLDVDFNCKQIIDWMWNVSKQTAYTNTLTEFLSPGDVYFKRLIQDLKLAKKTIFMEFFIICPGKMWNEVVDILVAKVKEGVDVRLIYDDFGTIASLPVDYPEYMKKLGIRTKVFNIVKPRLDAFMNNRDHRKIVVIDGNISYTGGINLADEYINEIERFGYWQDCGIRLEGDATASFTILFLRMWHYLSGEKSYYQNYMPTVKLKASGVVVPFGDNPIRDHNLHDSTYLKIITCAKKYVYIETPYLVMDYELTAALIFAAESGVEVVIITPHIPDKAYVHALTRSSYKKLIKAGVKIYEFTPGFIHSKLIVADDSVAVVGTANFDFRSLYLHFECSVFLYKTASLQQIYCDFKRVIGESQEITLEKCKQRSWIQKLLGFVLRPFAPLM